MGAWNDGFAAALAAVRTACGVAVTYTRAASRTSFPATAAVGKTVHRADPAGNNGRAAQRVETRDYLLPAAAFHDASGKFRPPEAGDQILEAGATHGVAGQFGEPCWRWSDPGRTQVRVHTVAVT